MVCQNNRLVIKIKSGEARGIGITIKTNSGTLDPLTNKPIYNALDLSPYTISFQIKKYPYFTVEPIIDKEITMVEDGTVGWILNQAGDNKGKFIVQITLEDLAKLTPEKDYYLILTLISGDTRTIISGENEKSGIFRVCKS